MRVADRKPPTEKSGLPSVHRHRRAKTHGLAKCDLHQQETAFVLDGDLAIEIDRLACENIGSNDIANGLDSGELCVGQ